MEKKYKIEFDGKELVFENEKEFKKFKTQCYNIHCDIMMNRQLNEGKVIRKSTGPTPEPEITLRDVLVMINNLTLEVREGFKKQEEFNIRQEDFNNKQVEFNKMVLDVFKRNNLK